MTSQYDPLAHWVRKPVTTRHSQLTLLMVSMTWGIGYLVPDSFRIPFAEVFPPALEKWSSLSMHEWGALLLSMALLALVAERMIMASDIGGRWGWRMSLLAHSVLAGTFAALGAAALYTGLQEAHGLVPSIISAISRPTLWLFMAWLHTSYARLPRPTMPKRKKKPRAHVKLFVRVPPNEPAQQ